MSSLLMTSLPCYILHHTMYQVWCWVYSKVNSNISNLFVYLKFYDSFRITSSFDPFFSDISSHLPDEIEFTDSERGV